MALTVTASTAAYLGQISDSTTSTAFDAGGADLLLVAVGWTDPSGGVPSVSFGGHALSPMTAPRPTNSYGIVAIFVLANPPAGSQALVVESLSSFIGNTEFNAVGLSGAAGTIGDTQSAIAAGAVATATPTGTAGDSVVIGFCLSLWAGAETVSSVTGWTQLATAAGSDGNGNGFSYSYQAAGGSTPGFTVTPDAGAYPLYFSITVEVQAASVVTAPVPVTAATAAYLGVISNSAGTVSFDTGGANLLIVAVGCADETGGVPTVTYDGQQLRPLLDPRPASSLGAVYLMMLADPPAGAHDLVVSAVTYIGVTQVAAWGLAGAAGTIGVRAATIQQQFQPATITLAGTLAGSTLLSSVVTLYAEPATMTPPFGWTQQATATGATGSIFAYSSYVSGGDEVFMVAPPTYAQMLVVGLEVFQAGHVVAAPPVTITASSVSDIGTIGVGSGSVSFDCAGAKMLVAVVAWTNTTPAPTITYGGIPLRYVSNPGVVTPTVGSMAVAVLMDPPAGAHDFVATGRIGYSGTTLAMLAGVSGLSGVAGAIRAAYEGGHQLDVSLAGSKPSSLILAFAASDFARDQTVVSEGWTQHGQVLSTSSNGWFWTAPGAANAAIELLQQGYSQTQLIAIEFQADLQTAPDLTGTGSADVAPLALRALGERLTVPPPNGQQYHMYIETFFHNPTWDHPQPQDFDLANVPAYIGNLCLSFGIPQCTYVDLTSDIKATVGLNWPGSATLLQQTIAVLKARCPAMKITLCVQQNTAEVTNDEPYSPTGWGGMTSDHIAAMRKFVDEMGIHGIVIDYECLSSTEDIAHHCSTDLTTGAVTCYTDTEQLAVIKAIRAGFPRPYIVILDALHVGCYGVAPFVHAAPASFNGGYNLCLTRDADALAALDGIHIETYDAGGGYDPRVALQAFQHFFPSTPLYVGLRVGPPDNGGYKRTLAELTDYVNCAVMRGAAGVFLYAMEWDISAPSGDYGPNYPDANMASYMAASRLGLPEANRPLVSNTTRNSGPALIWTQE